MYRPCNQAVHNSDYGSNCNVTPQFCFRQITRKLSGLRLRFQHLRLHKVWRLPVRDAMQSRKLFSVSRSMYEKGILQVEKAAQKLAVLHLPKITLVTRLMTGMLTTQTSMPWSVAHSAILGLPMLAKSRLLRSYSCSELTVASCVNTMGKLVPGTN